MQSEMVRNISLIRYLFVQMGIRDKINIHKWFIIDNMVKILPLRYPIASLSFLHSSAHDRHVVTIQCVQLFQLFYMTFNTKDFDFFLPSHSCVTVFYFNALSWQIEAEP